MKLPKKIIARLKAIVNQSDELDYDNASASIKKNIAFKGPNVFILACAIIIASVGLNVNSIPVIIGAMLISPVMGPILGFGLGLGTQDNTLVKNAAKNYVIMVVISIMASSLFFLLSPLSLANPSELLARTRPTIYDVLIALFGGFAGIIETSRKEKGTVISGVAIATALMPPLCTVGYGLSRLNWHFMLGALYLFLINSIFIALATFLTVKFFKFPLVESTEEKKQLPKSAMYIILVAVIVPSLISAFRMVKENNFDIHAEQLVSENTAIGKGFIYKYETHHDSKAPTLVLFVAGETPPESAKERLYERAETFGITRSQIIFHEDATSIREDISETEVVRGIYEHTDRQISRLNDSIARMNARLNEYKNRELPVKAVSQELFAQYPEIKAISLTRGSSVEALDGSSTEQIAAFISTESANDAELHDRIERWLKVRLNTENVMVIISSDQPAEPIEETGGEE